MPYWLNVASCSLTMRSPKVTGPGPLTFVHCTVKGPSSVAAPLSAARCHKVDHAVRACR